MNKKKWLKRAWDLQREIEFCEQIIEDPSIYSSPDFGEKVTQSKGNQEEDKINHKLSEINRAKKERVIAIVELEKRKTAINNIQDIKCRKVLYLRYIEHYSWESICLAMNYSRSRCNAFHNKGIELLKII